MRFWFVLLAVLLVAAPLGATATGAAETETVSWAADDDISIAPVALVPPPERVETIRLTRKRVTLAPAPTGDPVFRPPRAR
ncbi:MAG: hypothetical protein WKG01_16835 [Kofleriaceae bacterium]